MEVFSAIQPLRVCLKNQRSTRRISFVPTMGALHDGHRACIEEARRVENAYVVASIFVNPTQFAPGEDFSGYPRDPARDVALCESWGCDAVFTPSTDDMYPREQRTWVDVEGMTSVLCGASRPGHFRGVTTVVSKLFHIVGPDVAVFGQKDAQQALVIREMVRQLNMPVELRIARTVREDDGLAMSSRNAYLGAAERTRAAGLFAALEHGAALLGAGERDPGSLETAVQAFLAQRGTGDVEYAEVRSAEDLSSLGHIEGRVILALAVRVGRARLIDNMVFRVSGADVVVDANLF